MDFKELLSESKRGRAQAVNKLLEMYQPLLFKTAIINGIYDEDLYQELCITFLKCLSQFRI